MRGFSIRVAMFAAVLAGFGGLRADAQGSKEQEVETYSEQGQQALATGNYSEAERAFVKLRELEPGVAEIHANLGLIYFEERRFDLAVPALRQALRLKPGLPKTDTLLAMSLSELGRYNEALPGLEKGFHHAGDPEIRRMCGLQLERAYTGLRKNDKAVEVALEMSDVYPNDPEVLYHSGQIFGNYAFLSMQKLAKVAPNSVWRHQAAGEAFESEGANDLAIHEYRTVLAMDPRRPGVHYRLGRTLLARSIQTESAADKAEALQEFEAELQLDPGNANAAYEIGEIHRSAGEMDVASEFFERALKYYPDFEEAHLGLASVLLAQQKPEQALGHLQKAVALNPENDVTWYRLALAYRALGNPAEQQKALAQFRRLKDEEDAREKAGRQMFSPSEVTQQKLDADAK